jgi:hypothetical protein
MLFVIMRSLIFLHNTLLLDAGHSPNNGIRMSELLYDNVVAFSAGKPLRNVVDKTADQFVKPKL